MTNLSLLSLATLAALAGISTPKDADACGGYMPQLRVFRIAQHGGRAFAITRHDAREGVAFTRIGDRMSFDQTQLAVLGRSEQPVALTLVGAQGNAQVTTRDQVLLARDFAFAGGKQMAAMELPPAHQQFAIAVAGEHEITEWRDAIDRGEPTKSERKWLVDTKVVAHAKTAVSRTDLGGGLVGFTQWNAEGKYAYTTVRNADGDLATSAAGEPIGVVVADGETWIVVERDGLVRAQQVY